MNELVQAAQRVLNNIRSQLPSRMTQVSVEIRNSVYNVMNGGPSAPGQPPGVRSGRYRGSFVASASGGGDMWQAKATSNVFYGPYLEGGTRKMAARPHVDKIAQDALPKAIDILSASYN